MNNNSGRQKEPAKAGSSLIQQDENFRVLMQQSVGSQSNSHEIGNQILIADWKKRQYDKNGFTLPVTARALYLYASNRKSHSRSLANNMGKGPAGLSKPKSHAAHHIVAAKDKRAGTSRLVMFNKGIGINDRCNGVFLLKAFHNRIHTDVYYAHMAVRLNEVKTEAPQTVRQLLVVVGKEIKSEAFPY